MSVHGGRPMTLRECMDAEESPPRARTQSLSKQLELTPCAWVGCAQLFHPRNPAQRFCTGKCRAAHSREVGLVGTLVSSRRLRRRISLIIHTEDAGVLDAPLGTRFRLVREP